MSEPARRRPTRRAVLLGGAAVAVAGCLPDESRVPALSPDDRLRRQVARAVIALHEAYLAAAAVDSRAASLVEPLAAELAEHVAALLPRRRPPAPTPLPPPAGSIAEVAAAAQASAVTRAAEARTAEPRLARLLAAVGAAHATHADLLGGKDAQATLPTVSLRADEVAVGQDVLAALHAVVYGYGVAGAHLSGADLRTARADDRRNRGARDLVVRLVIEGGADPVPPQAAYPLPQPVTDPASARRFALLLEDRLAAVWADAVLGLRGRRRDLATTGLRETARAAARWRGSSAAFPGAAERS